MIRVPLVVFMMLTMRFVIPRKASLEITCVVHRQQQTLDNDHADVGYNGRPNAKIASATRHNTRIATGIINVPDSSDAAART